MMLPFEEALSIVLDSAHRLDCEPADIGRAANRVLAETVMSDNDLPPFDRSLRDGYACRKADLANELTVIETIPAGHLPTNPIGPDQCAKIMTGGVMPENADCVLMKEHVGMQTGNTIRFTGTLTEDFVSRKAEDVGTGEVVLSKNTLLKPHHIAVLATVGKIRPLVSRSPRTGIMATGSELIDPSGRPEPSQIRNSNSSQLAAQIQDMGAVAADYGIAEDTKEAIDAMFKDALRGNDVVIVSGGVSVGDFDFVPEIMKQNGFSLRFEKVAVKPGRPTVFGVAGKRYCFGLPGNPVSSFVQFEMLIKPFLYKLMGHDYRGIHVRMPLHESYQRRNPERLEWIPAAITETGTVQPVEYHGSAHISALCRADGLMCIDTGVSEIGKGTMVKFRML